MRELISLLLTCNLSDLFYTNTNNAFIQLFRYCFVGGMAFIIDFGLYCLLGWFGVHYLIAGVFAFVISFSFNFLFSRWLIFAAKAENKIEIKEIICVLTISVIGLGLTELLLFVGTDLLLMDFRMSKIAVSLLVLIWNYIARKIWVYK